MSRLSLPEELLLLAFDPDAGRPVGPASVYLAAAGGLLLELTRGGAVELHDDTLRLADATAATPVPTALQRAATEAIARERKPRDLKHWVRHFAAPRFRLGQQTLDAVSERGVLHAHTQRRFLVFTVQRHELVDRSSRERLVTAVRGALLSTQQPSADVAVLTALAGAGGLVDRVVDRAQRDTARRRLDELTRGDATAQAVTGVAADIQREVTAAVIAATTAAAISVSASTGS